MKRTMIAAVSLLSVLWAEPAVAQHHESNWIHRTATDTTIVPCWTDSTTWMAFPPNSMNMMMMPDSLFMRIDRMWLDSLRMPHDSTIIGWCRVQAGRDSTHFDMMNGDSMYGSRNMMQFMMGVRYQFHWDSVMTDSAHRHWHPTGMKGWSGSGWTMMSGVSVSGGVVRTSSAQAYSALAFVGAPTITAGVAERQNSTLTFTLAQNYPNPFNPTTTISYSLPAGSRVTLSVFNALGQHVATLVNGEERAGEHAVEFAGTHLASGVYYYRLQSGSYAQTRALILLR